MNMDQWKNEVIADGNVRALPIMTYPGLDLTGLNVRDVVTNGRNQSSIIEELARRYPCAAAAVTIMDLSVEAEAFGSTVVFTDHEIPNVIGELVGDLESARALRVPKVGEGRTGEYLDGMRRAATAIDDRPVFGGCIGPVSLAARLLDVNKTLLLTRRNPPLIHAVLRKCTEFLAAYLEEIKSTGVDGVVIAEPLAGLLSPAGCHEFSSNYVRELVKLVQDQEFSVILHNCGNTVKLVDSMLSTDAAILHFGNAVKLVDIAPQIPPDRLFCGNINPATVFRMGTPEIMTEAVEALLDDMKDRPNFVLSSGCDIPPKSPLANLDAFFETAARINRERSAASVAHRTGAL